MKRHLILFTWSLFLTGESSIASPSQGKTQPEVFIEADSIVYDQHKEEVVAKGNVIVTQGVQYVRAQKLTYFKKNHLVVAEGDVSLLDEKGNVAQGDYFELTHGLKEAVGHSVRLFLQDNGSMVAHRFYRRDGKKIELKDVIYTPCRLCRKKTKPPLWHLRAASVRQDEENGHVIYRNAFLHFKDLPVFYTPYFRHPSPKIQRKSGFLPPSIQSSKNIGVTITTPYFWDIGPHQDMTLTPYLMTKKSPILGVEHRRHGLQGVSEFRGSLGYDKRENSLNKHKVRGHLAGMARIDLTSHWRAGLDLERSSDETYLKQYRFFGMDQKSSLNSKVFTEGFYGRHYASIAGHAFQPLSLQYRKEAVPIILPEVDLSFWGTPGDVWKGQWFANTNNLSVFRQKGTNVQRVVQEIGWQRTDILSSGQIYTWTASLRGDLYHVQNYNPMDPDNLLLSPSSKTVNQWTGRSFPQMVVDWKYPFVRDIPVGYLTVQPILSTVIAPYMKNKSSIPNEDARMFDLDDNNIFSASRMAGYDAIDSGSRFIYGGQVIWTNPNGRYLDAFIGRSYTPKTNALFASGSGLNKKHSDYVGRLLGDFSNYLKGGYKFRIDPDARKIRRQDLFVSVGPPILKATCDYFYFDKAIGSGDGRNQEQARLSLSSDFAEGYQGSFETVRDLAGKGKTLENAASLTYKDECFTISSKVFATYYRDRDLKADRGFIIKVVFKNLGSL